MKNTRWTKIHNSKDADFERKPNVLYITVDSVSCNAHAIFTSTYTYRKAADWLFSYLELAKVGGVAEQAKTEVMAKAAEANRDDAQITVADSDEIWNCVIQKLQKGVFDTRMSWKLPEAPAEESKPNDEPQAAEETPAAEEPQTVEEPNDEPQASAEEPPVTGGTPEPAAEETKSAKKSKKKGGKPLTYEKLRALAKKCYMEGGDTVYECWSEDDFNKYVEECGPMTRADALNLFHTLQSQYGQRASA